MIQEIFRVPIYKIKLDLNIKKLQSFCNIYQQGITGRIISNVGGYQSNDLPLDDVVLQPLIEEIKIHSSEFAKTFTNKDKQDLVNIWFNINLYNDSNSPHVHTASDVSGVYYIKVPNNSGNIVFENPACDVFDWYYTEQLDELNAYNSKTWWIPSEVNMLYLFPAWLKHSVEASKNKTEERISIGFNTRKLRGHPRRKGDHVFRIPANSR